MSPIAHNVVIALVIGHCAKVLYAFSVLLCTRSADQMMVFLPGDSKNTILPHGMANVREPDERRPASLVEMGLRALCAAGDEFYKTVCDMLSDGCLPGDIAARIANGPTTVCGCDECSVPLFTECYFLLLKKNRSSSHIIFSNMFCSKDCTLTWMMLNGSKYNVINWTELLQL